MKEVRKKIPNPKFQIPTINRQRPTTNHQPPPTVFLREFDLAADYDAVVALWRTSWPGVKVGRSDTPAELAKKLQRDPDLFLVAEIAGRIVGTVIGGFDGRRGLVYHLAIAPEQRGRGLGAALMTELETRLKTKGCVRCYLLVAPDNFGVTGLYRRLGWEEMPVRIMAKDLV